MQDFHVTISIPGKLLDTDAWDAFDFQLITEDVVADLVKGFYLRQVTDMVDEANSTINDELEKSTSGKGNDWDEYRYAVDIIQNAPDAIQEIDQIVPVVNSIPAAESVGITERVVFLYRCQKCQTTSTFEPNPEIVTNPDEPPVAGWECQACDGRMIPDHRMTDAEMLDWEAAAAAAKAAREALKDS